MPTIHLAGTGTAFHCAVDDTITRAALRAGIALPYECNTGACGTCKVELVSGDITSLRPDSAALTDRDRARNRILGCQAQPQTDCVIKARVEAGISPESPPESVGAVLTASRDVTHDIREFSFELSVPRPFLPGQYALLRVPTVGAERAYSMSNTPGDTCWRFHIKRMPGGRATTVLFDQLAVGAMVGLDGPYGHAYLRPDAPRDVVCIAGGSGIAPVLSIARAMAASPALSGRRLFVFYGGRRTEDICGDDTLRTLPALEGRYTYVPVLSAPDAETSDAWAGRTGLVHEAVPEVLGGALPDYEFYFAGPPAMTQAVQALLFHAKVPISQMHFDQFF